MEDLEKEKNDCTCSEECTCGPDCNCTPDNKCCPECTCDVDGNNEDCCNGECECCDDKENCQNDKCDYSAEKCNEQYDCEYEEDDTCGEQKDDSSINNDCKREESKEHCESDDGIGENDGKCNRNCCESENQDGGDENCVNNNDCESESCDCDNIEEDECKCGCGEKLEESTSDAYFKQLLSLQAEFDNYRKRTQSDISKAYQNGFNEAITQFIPALDSFKMATEYITDQNTLVGIQYIEKGILATLEKMGIEVINTTGKFDPNFHQAIGSEPSPSHESGDIIKECFKGFKMGDKVIRYAQVIVAK